MNIFSHHAYFVTGGQKAVPEVISFLEGQGVKTKANPDFWINHFDNFGIDDSRKLKEMDSRNAIGDHKFFLISFNSITAEAQNALLKTFEEPLGNSFYIIFLNKRDELLPTLRSRVLELPVVLSVEDDKKEAEDFLLMTLDERMAYAHKFSEDIKKDKRTKQDAINFLNMLERVLSEKRESFKSQDLLNFLEVKNLAAVKGSSVKMLIEMAGMYIK